MLATIASQEHPLLFAFALEALLIPSETRLRAAKAALEADPSAAAGEELVAAGRERQAVTAELKRRWSAGGQA